MNQDQRAAFEAWHKKEMWASGYDEKIDDPDAYEIDDMGYYFDIKTQIAWRGYQAALESPEVQAMKHDIDEYVRITSELTSENEALRKYKDRLRFVADDNCSFNTWVQDDYSVKYRLGWYGDTEWQDQWYDSPEEAIDAAIAAAMEE